MALLRASVCLLLLGVLSPQQDLDVVVTGGTVYDGSGRAGVVTDVGISGDRIVAVGDLSGRAAKQRIEAHGMAVSPGFINMLSWSTESLIADGRSQSELRQGVTTQIFGEGWSMGPLTAEMKKRQLGMQGDIKYDITWTSLSEYLQYLEKKGIAQNVASYVGATTLREYVIGLEDKKATAEQIARMRQLVRQEMEAGALGIGSSLIYPPASYSTTEELIELCKEAAKYQGKYITHMRSEGSKLVEAVEEVIRIAREARLPAEIYHLKAAGKENWPKMDTVLEMIEAARKQGLKITADMYMYEAGATGIADASFPRWALDGGYEKLFQRLRDAEQRKKIAAEVTTPSKEWENLYLLTGSPERILLVSFRNDALKKYTGMTLAAVAQERGKDPVETMMDLVLEDQSRVGAVYFLMTEENTRKQIRRPWVSLGSDAESMAPEGVFLKSAPHPRAYGNFARLLGKYVREDKVITLEDAIYRLSGLPAGNLGLHDRGVLREGAFADVVIFDPAAIADHATYDKPQQYATGVRDVFVNGVQVIKQGNHTGALPGRALKGPGAK